MNTSDTPRWRTLALTSEEREKYFARGDLALSPPAPPIDNSRQAKTRRVLAALAEVQALPAIKRGDISFIAKKHDVSAEAVINRLAASDLRVRLNAPRGRKTGMLLVCEVNRVQKSSDNFEPTARRSA